MALKFYIPRQEGNLVTWLLNLKAKLLVHGTTLGFSTTEILALNTAIDALVAEIQAIEQQKNDLKEAVSTKDTNKGNLLGRVIEVARKSKVHSSYTEAIGKDLGIIGEDSVSNPDAAQPTLTLTKLAEGVKVSFKKEGWDGVKIYSQRGSEAAFSFLATDTQSPYIDNRPNLGTGAETRKYKAVFLDGDGTIGLESAVVEVGV